METLVLLFNLSYPLSKSFLNDLFGHFLRRVVPAVYLRMRYDDYNPEQVRGWIDVEKAHRLWSVRPGKKHRSNFVTFFLIFSIYPNEFERWRTRRDVMKQYEVILMLSLHAQLAMNFAIHRFPLVIRPMAYTNQPTLEHGRRCRGQGAARSVSPTEHSLDGLR